VRREIQGLARWIRVARRESYEVRVQYFIRILTTRFFCVVLNQQVEQQILNCFHLENRFNFGQCLRLRVTVYIYERGLRDYEKLLFLPLL
jgi:hypothetical protein